MPSNGALTRHCVKGRAFDLRALDLRALDFGALKSREFESRDVERCAGVGRSAQAPR